MKRHLTLAAIAVALGLFGWRHSPQVRADGNVPSAFEQVVPTVNAAPSAVAANDSADTSVNAENAGGAGAEPSAVDTTDNAEPLALDEDAAAGVGSKESAESGESPSDDSSSTTTEPPVHISDDGLGVEVIRERYPNRAVKIEREVTQDAEGNYVNHGSWKMWDAQGSLVVEGQYQYGERIGVWNRWYRTAEVELLKAVPYSSFHGPFISQASFDLGRLNGKWTIYDSHQHKISEWEFVDGERHGNFTWWFPNGQKMRECHYDGGEMNGQLLEWAVTSKLVTEETFEHGRRLGSRSEKHKSGGTKSEGLYLFAREVVQTPDDWANAKPAVYIKQGKDERHGHWIVWYPNGQKQTEGEYDHDVQVGEFSWWFANGQRALQGEYADGEQQGKWVWWHENGQKSIVGEYKQGHPIGQWTWWNEDGKVARASEMAQGAGEVVQTPAPLPTTAAPSPSAAPPAPRSATRPRTAPGQPRPSTVR